MFHLHNLPRETERMRTFYERKIVYTDKSNWCEHKFFPCKQNVWAEQPKIT